MRIVSLLPSATDIVVALGAQEELVGVSHSCGSQMVGSSAPDEYAHQCGKRQFRYRHTGKNVERPLI